MSSMRVVACPPVRSAWFIRLVDAIRLSAVQVREVPRPVFSIPLALRSLLERSFPDAKSIPALSLMRGSRQTQFRSPGPHRFNAERDVLIKVHP